MTVSDNIERLQPRRCFPLLPILPGNSGGINSSREAAASVNPLIKAVYTQATAQPPLTCSCLVALFGDMSQKNLSNSLLDHTLALVHRCWVISILPRHQFSAHPNQYQLGPDLGRLLS